MAWLIRQMNMVLKYELGKSSQIKPTFLCIIYLLKIPHLITKTKNKQINETGTAQKITRESLKSLKKQKN